MLDKGITHVIARVVLLLKIILALHLLYFLLIFFYMWKVLGDS